MGPPSWSAPVSPTCGSATSRGLPSPTVAAVTVIEVYADIWCPFAHVGLRTVVKRRHELRRDDVALRVRAWPLELVNNAALDPQSTAEHVADLRSQVAPDLFTGFDIGHFPRTTLPALRLASAAYRQDDTTGETVSLALRDALFEHGEDISDPDVIARIAETHHIQQNDPEDDQPVLDEWHDGETRGVKGSPHFFCGTSESFCPSLGISKDQAGQLHIRLDTEALDEYLTGCFNT